MDSRIKVISQHHTRVLQLEAVEVASAEAWSTARLQDRIRLDRHRLRISRRHHRDLRVHISPI